ncbi:ExbD/TolR family protein [Egbenema bharatensis]|uniref:ExbD/TolR family protein n=1 Tax=Egbenema bharatensis TaxID=3463334 RepID=UPI003A887A54
MRFKHQRQAASIPEVNLTPMLNVMMGILAFFVMITMLLTAQEGVQVELPGNPDTAPSPPPDIPEPLIVNLTTQGILLNQQPIADTQLEEQMQLYLAANPEGTIALQPELDVPYDRVLQLLSQMSAIGGEQVSLAID